MNSGVNNGRLDDEIYDHFIKDFPEYDSAGAVAEINEDDMKSPKGKERWRKFMNTYEKTVCGYRCESLL
jgi:hypothetical protein